mmetsp:Transcript_60861/g.100685  ORF Transcript_60861/g.100685 Transcript_60861/m.100685 type:complete len:116 (+) Transcript_60861:1706-2053(+)
MGNQGCVAAAVAAACPAAKYSATWVSHWAIRWLPSDMSYSGAHVNMSVFYLHFSFSGLAAEVWLQRMMPGAPCVFLCKLYSAVHCSHKHMFPSVDQGDSSTCAQRKCEDNSAGVE